ncbi:MAG: hypothetical protein CMG60_08635 [Candidatus Marinimicrobia bacterium]|nr:hypothetical protein [Candidatus Neomarinimicrobiota bacterium]
MNVEKILIVRFSSIGDIVLATSPLRTIRTLYPNAQISFLTLEKFAPLLEFHPDIDCLLSINHKASMKYIWEYGKYIVKNKYDIIYDLHNSIRSNMIISQSRKSIIHQLKKPRLKRALLFYLHTNLFEKGFNTRFMYHQYLGINLNENRTIPETYLSVSQFEKQKAKQRLLRSGIIDNYIVVIPGAAWHQKQWEAKKYVKTLNEIGMPSVLVGSKMDIICDEIGNNLDNAINISGKTDIREALAIIANAKYVLGSDTGLVHAAEAMKKKVTIILGPTSSETGADVIHPDSKLVEKDIWCRPCSQNGSSPCYRKKQYCMDNIEPEDVLRQMQIESH